MSIMVAHGTQSTGQVQGDGFNSDRAVLGHLGSPLLAMAARFIVQVSDDADYKDAVLDAPRGTLCVVDVYASWCGPCDALNKKITNLYQDNTECAAAAVAAPSPRRRRPRRRPLTRSRATRRLDIKFVQAQSDGIEALADYRERSKPLFLLYKGGSECARMEGANALELGRVVLSKASSK